VDRLRFWRRSEERRARQGLHEGRCEAIIDTLPIEYPFNIHGLAERLGCRRQRPLALITVAMGGKPFALWVGLRTMDIIFYEQNTPSWHQEHLILHEIGHMLLEHRTVAPPAWLRSASAPTTHAAEESMGVWLDHTAEEEREADEFADWACRRVAAERVLATRARDPRSAAFLDRLASLSGDGELGWSQD